MPAWNVLATSLEGRRDALLIALRRLGKFRGGGYRNVVVGRVADQTELLDRVREMLAGDPLLPTALAKIVPIELTVRFDPNDPLLALAAAAERFVDRLSARSFFVRLERRGFKGRLHSPTLEREIGERVWRALEARGERPRVDFRDPDEIIVVETLGEDAGLALLSRELRKTYPFVKVR